MPVSSSLRDLRAKGVLDHIHEKSTANATPHETQEAANRRKSRILTRVEHLFSFMLGTKSVAIPF
jgi:hypothetical protein